ncbi:MAG: hypothetical protein V2A58_02380 [Planctomycetota bacterium]
MHTPRHLCAVFAIAAFFCAGCAAPRPSRHGGKGIVERNSRPFFPLEIYGIKTESDFRIARHLGFDALIDDGPLVFPLAGKYRFPLTLPNWLDRDTTEKALRAKVRAWRGRRPLFAWNLADEPDLRHDESPPALLERFAGIIREEDPSRLVSVTLSGAGSARRHWKDYIPPVDVVRLSAYPVAEGATFEDARERLRLARDLAFPSRSVWFVLQAWRSPEEALPSPAELRLGAYLAVIEGARGLSVFDFNLETWLGDGAFFEELLRVLPEARLLRDLELHFPARVPDISPASLSARAWETPGGTILAVVNPSDEEVQATLRAPPSRIEALRRHGPLRVEGGVVSLPLAAHETLLLKLSPERGRSRDGPRGLLDAGPASAVYDLDSPFLFALGRRSMKRVFYRNPSDEPEAARVLNPRVLFYLTDLEGGRWERLSPVSGDVLSLPPHSTVEAVDPRADSLDDHERPFVSARLSLELAGGPPLHPGFEHTIHRFGLRAEEPLELSITVEGAPHAQLAADLYDFDRSVEDAVEVVRIDGPKAAFRIRVRPQPAARRSDLTLKLTVRWKGHAVERRVRLRAPGASSAPASRSAP